MSPEMLVFLDAFFRPYKEVDSGLYNECNIKFIRDFIYLELKNV